MEEGGVRELLSFVANGIVKHQAILLGKAETTKKKKVLLLLSRTTLRGHKRPGKMETHHYKLWKFLIVNMNGNVLQSL